MGIDIDPRSDNFGKVDVGFEVTRNGQPIDAFALFEYYKNIIATTK